MASSSFREKTIQVKNNNGYSSRQLPPREIPVIDSSTEVYYGRSNVGIPFTWESEPGTPKVRYYDRPLPPLTPPPFICCSRSKKPHRKPSKTSILTSCLPKLNFLRTSRTPHVESLSSSSSSRSSSFSVSSSSFTPLYRREKATKSSTRWSFEEGECRSHNSTFCFGFPCGLSCRTSMGCLITTKTLSSELA